MFDGIKIKKTELITVIGIVFFYILFSILNYSSINEDAFIYFRFVENLANGYGYVFNQGERVEGCSSVTWLFLLTFFRILEFNILTVSKILGIFFGSITLFLIFQITKQFTVKMPWIILPSLLTAFSLPFFIWSQMGLETSLYTMVFLTLVFILINNGFFKYWPIVALILVLTRPEGIFLLLGVMPALYFQKGKKVILSILIFAFMWMIVIFIRFIYFHDFLPSPFYAKISEDKYISGLQYIHFFFKQHYIYYFGAPLVFILPQKFNWQKERIILFGFIVVCLAWIILGGSEPKPYYRHIVIVIPILYIYLITGIQKLIGEFTSIKKVVISIYIIAFCIVTLIFPKQYLGDMQIENPIIENMRFFLSNPGDYLKFCSKRLQNPKEFNYVGATQSRQLLLGEFIKQNYPSGTTFLYDQMGRTPYQASIDYYFIDSWGLTDKKIGKYYFHETVQASPLEFFERIISNLIKKFYPQSEFINSRIEAVDYIFEQRNPDVIMIFAPLRWVENHLPFWLIKDRRFGMRYERRYLIEGVLVFESKLFKGKKRPLQIPEGLTITTNKRIEKALKIFGNNKIVVPSLKDQIDNVISKQKSIGNTFEPSLTNLWLEAEDADTIVSPLRIASKEDASKGKYIYSPNDTGNQFTPGVIMATYIIDIMKNGRYILWGRVQTSDLKDNSFYVQIDYGLDNLWEIEVGNYWHWDKVNDRNLLDPVIFNLSKGKHTIKVKVREDGTKLDKMLLTNDLTFVPSENKDIGKNLKSSEGS